MSKLLLLLLLSTASVTGFTQKKQSNKKQDISTLLNGQWRGFFGSNGDIVASENDNIEYVLEINIQGTTVTGYSYSYFQNRAFYVICSVAGNLDRTTKTITVTETARLKGTTPEGGDCLQTHILTYKKEAGKEELSGKWRTAPGQTTDCGFGNTTLVRRTLSRNLATYNKANNSTAFATTKPTTKTPAATNHTKENTPAIKSTPEPTTPAIIAAPPTAPVTNDAPAAIQPPPVKHEDLPIVSDINYEKRNTNLLKIITIENPTIRIDLYDNGVVDGDSISLFYNNKLVLLHQRLSEKAIELTLNVNTSKQANDLTMYAENLGEIPPNTALMVVTDGDKRYEVPITSDLKNSGTVRFVFGGEK